MGERAITARSDIYSLGVVTYEMLAGAPPFVGPNAQAIVAQVLTAEPTPLTTHRKSVPEQVDAAVRPSLEKLPADRFATATEFVTAITTRIAGTRIMRRISMPGAVADDPAFSADGNTLYACPIGPSSRHRPENSHLPYQTMGDGSRTYPTNPAATRCTSGPPTRRRDRIDGDRVRRAVETRSVLDRLVRRRQWRALLGSAVAR